MVDMSRHLGFGNLTPAHYGYNVQSQVDMTGVQPSVTEKLGQLQAGWSSPLNVSSGYRSPGYNARVGGAKHSQHIKGNAIDIDTAGMTRAEVTKLAAEASRLGFNGIGFYPDSLHFDVRQTPAAWGPNYRASSIPGWAREVATNHLQRAYQGTAPAPAVAAVERQALPAVGPVPEARPQTVAAAPMATPTARPSFTPGGVLAPTKVDVSQFSPVSSAQAAPAQAAPAPSMARNPAAAVRSMPAPDVSRFGPTTPNINEANQLKSALQAQAASLAATAPDARVAAPTPSLASYAPTTAPVSAPRAFSPTPASYQTPAFSTAAPMVDAFGQPPAPGLAPASQLAQAAPAPTQMAPALAAPTRTISNPRVASVPAQIETPETPAPAPNPSLNQFPDKPKQGLLSGLLNPTTLAGAALGTAVMGPVGGLLGGLLGRGINNAGGLGGLLGTYNGPTNNIGSGLGAISQVLGGGAPVGSTAFSRSMPGMSVTALPGGAIQRTNQYGVTQITTADGRTGRGVKGRAGGAGGNYGGVKSEGARNAIDHGIGGLF